MTAEYGLPSPSGALIAGYDYQHLFTWLQALGLLREEEGITRIGLEVGGQHNVDDLVVHHKEPPPLYYQVKFVMAQGEPLSHEWFTDSGGATKSPLQRFYESFVKLSDGDVRPEMALETNRWPVAGDPILSYVDGQTHKLVPRLPLAAAGSASGAVRREWAEHLGIDEPALYEMLGHLAICAGRGSLEDLRERCCWRMCSVGLLDDLDSVDVGMGEIRRLIREGVRALDVERLRAIIASKRLERGAARATLLVQQIKKDPWPELATASVDWVDLFEGDAPEERRQLRDPSGWNGVLRSQLREARAEIERSGLLDVLVVGAMRLSTGLVVGAEMANVAGFSVAIRQGDEEWSSTGEKGKADLEVESTEVGAGQELAIGISIATDLSEDVLPFLENEAATVGRFVNFHLARGVGRDVIRGSAEARALAQYLLDAIRSASRGFNRVHLFVACPLGLALMLGHVWNRMPETQLYDDLGYGRGYAPTFFLHG